MAANLSEKEALARVVAEITEVIPLVEDRLERTLPLNEYARLARRLNMIVKEALGAGCLELPGGNFGDGLTSLPIYELKEGIVISPEEFVLWKGRMLKLLRDAEQRLNVLRSEVPQLLDDWHQTLTEVHTDHDVRPSQPTRDYCLFSRNRIRWEGGVKVEPRLWHLLGCLLDHGEETPIEDAEEAMQPGREIRTKTLSNYVSKLNQHLADVMFPWSYKVKGQYILQK
jgi:hypothetical protein